MFTSSTHRLVSLERFNKHNNYIGAGRLDYRADVSNYLFFNNLRAVIRCLTKYRIAIQRMKYSMSTSGPARIF